MIRELFSDHPIIMSVISLFILLILFFLIDWSFSKRVEFTGEVLDHHYSPESVTVGTGIVTTQQGSGVVTTTQTKSEQFLMMVRIEDGSVLTAECTPELYYSKRKKINGYYTKGLFTGMIWSVYGTN